MKALVYRGAEDVRCETVPDPSPRDVEGAVVRITRAGICGSDLHIYHGHGFSPEVGYVVGHEAVGEVVEVGSAVRRFRVGERVLVAGSTGCATCASCRSGEVLLCENGQASCYGIGPGLAGSQAEAVAVPAADTGLWKVPEEVSDEAAVLLTDNLPTAWYGARGADIAPGDSVAVVGLGPVGICALHSAFAMGAARVFGVDLVAERRAHAEKLGALALHPEDPRAHALELTKGRGVDRVIEAVGADATIQLALDLVRRGGSVSVVGVSQNRGFSLDLALAQVKSFRFRIGLCSVQAELPALLSLLRSGRIDASSVVSHRMPLADGAEAYRVFAERRGDVRKVLLAP